jgi:hypothetical protein
VNILSFCLIAAVATTNHPGGLDANGGHVEKKTGQYHTHRAPPPPPSESSKQDTVLIIPSPDERIVTVLKPQRISITRTNDSGIVTTKAVLEYNGSTWNAYCASWLAGTTGNPKNDLIEDTFKHIIIRHPTNAEALFNTVFYYHTASTNTQCESFFRRIARTTELTDSGKEAEFDYIFQWDFESNVSKLVRSQVNTTLAESFSMDQCRLIAELLPQAESLRRQYADRLK